MADLISTPLSNETRDAVLNGGSNYIRPIAEQVSNYIPGWIVASTTFVLGIIFILIFCAYIVFRVFGQPMSVAAKQGSLIQHFDTPKSAVMKDAIISGGASRYRNLRDGTLAVTTKSIVSMEGKNAIITFASNGFSIPIPQLTAMTKLTNEGISVECKLNPETNQYEYKLNKEIPEDIVVLSGYNFFDFKELIRQTKDRIYIPLMIECVENFVTKNISADYTEKKIKVRAMIQEKVHGGKMDFELLIYGLFAVGIPLITYMLLFKK